MLASFARSWGSWSWLASAASRYVSSKISSSSCVCPSCLGSPRSLSLAGTSSCRSLSILSPLSLALSLVCLVCPFRKATCSCKARASPLPSVPSTTSENATACSWALSRCKLLCKGKELNEVRAMRASSAFQTAPITEKPLKTLKEIKLREITRDYEASRRYTCFFPCTPPNSSGASCWRAEATQPRWSCITNMPLDTRADSQLQIQHIKFCLGHW